MTTLQEAADIVLGAWQTSSYGQPSHHKAMTLAMTMLRAAFSQPEQEPFCYMSTAYEVGLFAEPPEPGSEWADMFPVYTAPPQQPVVNQQLTTAPEPVAWMYDWYDETEDIDGAPVGGIVNDWISKDYDEAHSPTMGCHNIRPLYTAPPRREPVGYFTYSEEDELWEQCSEKSAGKPNVYPLYK